jgi:hypothetical protein
MRSYGMSSSKRLIQAAILVAILNQAPPATAVILGQVDDFEDGTLENWIVNLLSPFGGPPPPEALPVNVATGGPMGANDNFLRLTSLGGVGPGSRLTAINFMEQWAGDYITAGVGRITMDVNNLGPTDLFLRLLLTNATIGGPPTDVAFSTTAVFVPAGPGWTSVEFPLAPSDLTAALGTTTDALMTATELRIFHSTAATFSPGGNEAIVGSLGVDNITARAAIPELSSVVTWGLLAGMFGLVSWWTRG